MTSLSSIPRLALGFYPTPVEEMPRLRVALGGGPRLFIKRDDYTGPGFGGNKVRKLEYELARAIAEGCDTVLTMGGIRSNHCRVTAALAARLGLGCHLTLNAASIPAEIPASYYLDQIYGAEVHRVASREERAPAQRRLAEELRAAGKRPFEIALGASDPLGSLGYVAAALELAGQGVHPDRIYTSSSSGGTQAGLDAGLQVFGLERVRLIGVSPDDPAAAIARVVAELRDGVEELLGVRPGSLRRPLEVEDRFVGPGYGIPTPECEEAIRLAARTEGILLDPVYTGKTMAALIAALRAGEIGAEESVLFWHTGGQMALFTAGVR